MKELQDILRNYDAARASELACALATVVRVAGSTYRRPGARMLITEDGLVTGCVSGGCLERTVYDEARSVLRSREPRVVRFDSMSADDVVWGFGLGCDGIVDVLIEPLTYGEPEQMAFIADCFLHRRYGVIATVFAVEGNLSVNVGDRLILHENGAVAGTLADSPLRNAVLDDAQRVIASTSEVISYELPGGQIDVFSERIDPPLSLIIFGTGHDAVPLVRLAKELGWHVTLVDYRPANLARAQGLGADAVIAARPEEIGQHITLEAGGAAVIMNHNYLDDLEVLGAVLPSSLRYIGVLGPRPRTVRLLDDLRKRGMSITTLEIDRMHAPAGLDIGSDNPEEIALSIVAEIKAVMAGRIGGPLRDERSPLHSRIGQSRKEIVPCNVVGEECCGATGFFVG